ncbi:hypothetical protein ACFV2H_03625 [Streptomyces sp. NPDC059629]
MLLGLLARVAHTSTAPVRRPPFTWTSTFWAAPVVVASNTGE